MSNCLLAFFFLSLGTGLLDYIFLTSGFYKGGSQYAFLLNGLVIFHAPLLLLYTQSLTNHAFRLRWGHLLHATPYLIAMVLLFFFYYTQSPETQEQILKEVIRGKDISTISISVFGLIYELAYLIAIKRHLKIYREQIKEQFSNLEQINLNWLNFLVNVFFFSVVASTISNFIRHAQIEQMEWAVIIGIVGLFIFINSVLLKGLYHNETFLGGTPRGPNDLKGKEEILVILETLNQHLKETKPYLDPSLTINELAKQLEVPPRQLSALINQELGQSFFDLINRYRVEEAKRQLRESIDQKLTILEVMYQSGFNSKSSFNTAFKKYTGLTPSAFKAQYS